MGQRLVFQIEHNQEKLLNVYYHWSGYTESALEVASHYFGNFLDEQINTYGEDGHVSEKESLVFSIAALQKMGARLTEEAAAYLKEKLNSEEFDGVQLPFDFEIIEEGLHRNDGIIEIEEGAMERQASYGEMFISYDTEANLFFFPETFTRNEATQSLEGCEEYTVFNIKDTHSEFSYSEDLLTPQNLEILLKTVEDTNSDVIQIEEDSYILIIG